MCAGPAMIDAVLGHILIFLLGLLAVAVPLAAYAFMRAEG
jgi:hypothetical protein